KAAIEQALIDIYSRLNEFPGSTNVSVEVDGNILQIDQRDNENGARSLCVFLNNLPITTIEGTTLRQFKHHLEIDVTNIECGRMIVRHEVQDRLAAISFGHRCSTIVNGLVPKSATRDHAKHGLTEQVLVYNSIVGALRDIGDHVSDTFDFGNAVSAVSTSLKYSCGNCLEMAYAAAALAHLSAKNFLYSRGLKDVEMHIEIYMAESNGDHVFCVANFALHGEVHQIAIDPWSQVSMSYDDYVEYVTACPCPPYTNENSTFCVCRTSTDAVNSEKFITSTRKIFARYGLAKDCVSSV
ncbi:hypothetical protein, partial [Paraburkholderia sp. RL17-373-BIF-A]|uniref:hypothetical protein n=1 Tax=Paraburkholderia sp. RL17-373-BIF-A TaxID=3031629 RepID=UPI0038B74A8B